MSFTSCSQCCVAYLSCCCPKFNAKDKYAHVKYSSVKESSQVESDGNESSNVILDDRVKVFSFPQQTCELPLHPKMFMELPVAQQPTTEYVRRFSSPSSTSSTGEEYDLCVAGLTGLHEQLRRHSAIVIGPHMKKKSATLPRSISARSKPNVSTSKKTITRRASMPTIEIEAPWVPGLPIVEENILAGQTNMPTLQFSLHYDVQQSTLMVHLHHASNLPAKDRQGTSDPFVVLHLIPNKDEIFQSSVVCKTLNPIFDQSFQFQGLTPDDIRRQTLIFRIYDHDRFSRNDSIGMIALPLESADLYGVVMRMMVQDEKSIQGEQQLRGDVLIALSYDPQLALLKGVVLKAANLKKHDIVDLADPYIKIYLVHKGKRTKKWKSTVKKNTLTPIFNESFHFDISKEMNISDIHLEVLVMDYDRLSRNDIMGVILLGENIDHRTGRKHWIDMLQSPQQSISQWHSVLPSSLALKGSYSYAYDQHTESSLDFSRRLQSNTLNGRRSSFQ